MKMLRMMVALALGCGCASLASADLVTAASGGSQPISTVQPSLALNYIVRTEGVFNSLGEISLFAGNYAPGGWMPADGRHLSIAENTALFNALGTTYGGNGQTTFALPDLRGRVPIGPGTGPGLAPRTLGEQMGAESVTLNVANLPAHSHTLPWGGTTDAVGNNQPYSNMQPSLVVNHAVPLQGIYPSRESSFAEPVMGHVHLTARPILPDGWAQANGQLLPINQNQALFSLLGTFYGGNGQTTFALPDLRGRAAVSTGGTGWADWQGAVGGSETVTLLTPQLPPHAHDLPLVGDITGLAGGGMGVDNLQPSLTLNYIIALWGVYPPRDGGSTGDEPFIGQVSLFAGNFAPRGWAFANGSLLSIAQNTALFSILGTTYGGNGVTTFALPDLRGRVAIGAGDGPGLTSWALGQVGGADHLFLTPSQMPAHAHGYVPEPSALALLGVGGMALLARRRS